MIIHLGSKYSPVITEIWIRRHFKERHTKQDKINRIQGFNSATVGLNIIAPTI